MDRRSFLKVASVSGAGALATTACGILGDDAAPASPGTPTPAGAPGGGTPRPLPSSSAAPADWSALGKDLAGRLVRPSDADYDKARKLFNGHFDDVRPAAVAYVEHTGDIARCLEFVRRYGGPFAVRSGGHNYAGFSTGTGLIVDVSRLNKVTLDQNVAVVGAGTRLIDLYGTLAAKGRTVPGGSCPTVSISGLTQGGGIGVTARAYGLTCDNLVGATVVLADGKVVECDAKREPELFWALRGGGGGNFGVVTEFRFRTHPAPDVSIFWCTWPWSNANAAMKAWQEWAPDNPDALWSNMHLHNGPRVRSDGLYLGPRDELDKLVADLTARAGASPTSVGTSSKTFMEAMLYMAGCSGETLTECHLPGELPGQLPGGTFRREAYAAKNDMFDKVMPEEGRRAAIRLMEKGRGTYSIAFDAMGGATGRVAPGDTAFPHRRAKFLTQYIAQWNIGDGRQVIDRQISWLRDVKAGLAPYATGGAYVNYTDPDLTDPQQAYYGDNLGRLRRAKAKYDPNQLFTFAQAVTPG